MTNPYQQDPQNPYGQPSADPYAQPYSQQPVDPYAQQYGQPSADPYAQPQPYGDPYAQGYAQQPSDFNNVNAYAQPPMGYGVPSYSSVVARPSVGFVQAIKAFFQNYVKFDGRASLSEYWWAALFGVIVSIAAKLLDGLIHSGGINPTTGQAQGGIFAALFGFALLLPQIAVSIRRLHDTNRSGWNLLWALLPIPGWIILLVFYIGGSKPEGARFDGATQPKTGE